MRELSEHYDETVGLMQQRFDFIKTVTDSILEPPEAAGSHRAEIYKTTLKALVTGDRRTVVDYALKIAIPQFEGGVHLIYAMLHLPHDAREKGSWHRDGNSNTQRVFWFPLTEYRYDGLSYIPYSSALLLSRPMTLLASRTGMAVRPKNITIKKNTYYSWPPKLVHMGNLNTTAHASCALQIFLDKSLAYVAPDHLTDHDSASIAAVAELVQRAFRFDAAGAITSMNKDLFPRFPDNFRKFFFEIFQLRTKIDLQVWAPEGNSASASTVGN